MTYRLWAACVLYGEAFLECRQESGLDWRVSETSPNGLSTEHKEVKWNLFAEFSSLFVAKLL